jgi:hypothetical protein
LGRSIAFHLNHFESPSPRTSCANSG